MGRIGNWIIGKAPFKSAVDGVVNERTRNLVGRAVSQIKANLGYGYFGGYGNTGNSMQGGGKWPGGLSGTGGGPLLDHYRVRTNARTAYFDSSQAKSIVDRFADTVADIGLRLEATPAADILGLSPEAAEAWSQRVEQLFDLWARDKKQHRSENLTFYQSHHLYQVFQHRDNDIFVRLYYQIGDGLQNALQFEFIDPNQILGDALTSTIAPNLIWQDGIERDNRGREKSYNVVIQDSSEITKHKAVNIKRKSKGGRLHMLHGFTPDYAGQGRGYSRLAHALQEFQKLTDFTAANIMKAISESNITMYTKPSKENPASNWAEDLISSTGAGPATGGTNPNPPIADGDQTAAEAVKYCPLPEAAINQPGSVGVFNLMEGEDLKAFQGTAPAASYPEFVDAFTSHLAASMSIPVEVVLMKFEQNYSASRASLILFWRVANRWREEMDADYIAPIYEMWLANEIGMGRIQAPGWSDPQLRAAWTAHRLIGSPMPNIDPMRTAKADQVAVEMGTTTLGRLARDHNGSDGKANRATLTRELQELPVPPWGQTAMNKDDDKEAEQDD